MGKNQVLPLAALHSRSGKTAVFRDEPVRFLVAMRNPKTGETLPSPQYGEPEHLYLCREERERGSAPSDLDGKNRRHNGPEQDTKTIQTHLYNYDTTGVLRTIRNNAGVRWTLTWDSGVNFVQHIDGPLGRRHHVCL